MYMASFLSKFLISYQLIVMGTWWNMWHCGIWNGFRMFTCWFIAGWRGCMEASRKGLNALRNSHFPQDFTDWKRAKKRRESWSCHVSCHVSCQGLDKQMIAEQRRLRQKLKLPLAQWSWMLAQSQGHILSQKAASKWNLKSIEIT